MQKLREREVDEDSPSSYGSSKTSHLVTALEGVMQIQKRKVAVGPNDQVGIVLFNTVRSSHFMSAVRVHE